MDEEDEEEYVEPNNHPGLNVSYKKIIAANVTYELEDGDKLKITQTGPNVRISFTKKTKRDYYNRQTSKTEGFTVPEKYVPQFKEMLRAYLEAEDE
jgi:nucleoid DNA-binding protein